MMKTKSCHCCGGTGKELDMAALAEQLRAERVASGESLNCVASRMKISAPYLSDLERGRRNWSSGLVDRFRRALKGTLKA
jgi:transcriptional regulator with XRE-family HTH domain